MIVNNLFNLKIHRKERFHMAINLKKKSKMSKTDLIEDIAKDLGMSQRVVATVVNKATEKIGLYLKRGFSVTIMDFGTFKMQKVMSRKGRNIHTGETIMIPAHKRVKFTPGKKLSDLVSKKK